MARITTDVPLSAWTPPGPVQGAVYAAIQALVQVAALHNDRRSSLDGPGRETVALALEVLPSSLSPQGWPQSEEDWGTRVEHASRLVDSLVGDGDSGDIASSLLRIASTALRAAHEALTNAAKQQEALMKIRSAHITASHEAFVAGAPDGRLRDALIDIRDALAEATA